MSGPMFYGQWGEVKAWLYKVKTNPINKEVEYALMDVGKEIADKVKSHIEKQDLEWTTLAPATKEDKQGKKIMLETGAYMSSIRPEVDESSRYSARMTVAPRGIHPKSGLSMEVLGSFHEYGTSKMPSRPLWRIVFHEIKGLSSMKSLLQLAGSMRFGS